jgi:hypothetical protein
MPEDALYVRRQFSAFSHLHALALQNIKQLLTKLLNSLGFIWIKVQVLFKCLAEVFSAVA